MKLKSIKLLSLAAISLMVLFSCKKKIIQDVHYSNVIYDLDTTAVYSAAADKDKLKTPLQYISSLYADLHQEPIVSNVLNDLTELSLAVGDKQMVNQMFLNDFLQSPTVQSVIPTNIEMRDDIEQFVKNTYLKFFLRNPTEYEKYFLTDLIENDPDMTVEIIFTAFALSNEYQFY